MTGTSLVRYFERQDVDGARLHWGRADLDGMPFRGQPPLLTEEEYDDRVVPVAYYKNDFFDILIPEQNRRFVEVMDAILNGWFRLMHIERFHQGTTRHYVEWVELFMEDGSRMPISQAVLELARGQASGHPVVTTNSLPYTGAQAG